MRVAQPALPVRGAEVTRVWWVAAAFALCAVLCTICILYIDRPVELFVHGHQKFRIVFQAMAAPSLVSLPFALTFLTGYVIAGRVTWPPGPTAQKYLAVCAAILVATALKDELKWFFGRPWPFAWTNDGIYAFKPFIDSNLYGGFPSGHTAYISAPLLMLCWLMPKYKALWLTIIAIAMIGLVGAGYHYVGDVIAGLFVGLAAAAGTWALMPK
jgi:membrane-associated phospholipid phosphatase